ncbi:type II toxin-antitoxin system RelE/ParE family toxin [Fibrobacter sp.]|uniref:type II toxin-antitoxin system RelE/ParE family toxin n=1 Tax=Fibrobacter sp. TaxID=35828 RepID=UPI0038901E19
MEVLFKDKDLERCAVEEAYGLRKLGARRIKFYWKRLENIRQSSNFEMLRQLPGRFHELSGNRQGQWACDLDQPYRLVFRAGEDTTGRKWVEITKAEVLEIVDYHQ